MSSCRLAFLFVKPSCRKSQLFLSLQECHQKYPGTTVYVSRYEVRLFQSYQEMLWVSMLRRIHSYLNLLQVYNERIYDLLNEGVMPLEGWRHLEVKEDSLGQIFVDGLNQVKHCPDSKALNLAKDPLEFLHSDCWLPTCCQEALPTQCLLCSQGRSWNWEMWLIQFKLICLTCVLGATWKPRTCHGNTQKVQ